MKSFVGIEEGAGMDFFLVEPALLRAGEEDVADESEVEVASAASKEKVKGLRGCDDSVKPRPCPSLLEEEGPRGRSVSRGG